jgi:hypothetical protein
MSAAFSLVLGWITEGKDMTSIPVIAIFRRVVSAA